MKTSTNIKPVASLSSTLLARKGEAIPAVAATIYNNPGLAWDKQQPGGEKTIHHTKRMDTTAAPSVLGLRAQSASKKSHIAVKNVLKKTLTKDLAKQPAKQKGDSIALIFNIEDEHYMRLKYQAQVSGKTSKELIRNAIEQYLDAEGAPNSSAWVIKPSE
ncbi:MAG: hypothetical protein KAI27_06275 [Rhodospirillaceae bacterium]|nr:hypothetical protein [Rhodospirillaceae bacterium]